MARKIDNLSFQKSNGWMESKSIFNYQSRKSLNSNYFTYQSKKGNKSISFCLVKGDILDLDVSCLVHFYQHGKIPNNSIFRKAGRFYENDFNSKLLNNLSNLSKNKHSLFMSLSGDMINCEYILNLIYKCKNFPEDVKEKEIFKMIFEIYTNIFETANRSSIKSLAVPFIEIENEKEISLKALIEAIICITELFDNKDQSLKYLYLISEDEKILTKFDNLATNGFNLEFIIYKTPTQNQKQKSEILPVKNSQNNEMDKMVYLKKTKNFEDFYNKCGICGKNSLLLSNFLDEDFLKNCSKFKRNCKICSTGKNIANFFHKNNSIKSDTFCIYCAGDFIDKLKYSLCSSCLRNIDKAKSIWYVINATVCQKIVEKIVIYANSMFSSKN
ncbi:hypothetical protein BpHYR1_052811 [Brachionus plicatilis]|uniref:Uncharacterized protein n=1 Tax=Brachionus plicatilis TaxID=10195 RepID=A0A3M7P747_BRAPC|nr:hypothetical protein BpHYR1_052811 [Brachionus plicatilis]